MITEMSSSASASMIAEGLRVRRYTMAAPRQSGVKNSPICSNMWDRGSRERNVNSGVMIGTALLIWFMLATRLAWVSMTPLGLPVVPEV